MCFTHPVLMLTVYMFRTRLSKQSQPELESIVQTFCRIIAIVHGWLKSIVDFLKT